MRRIALDWVDTGRLCGDALARESACSGREAATERFRCGGESRTGRKTEHHQGRENTNEKILKNPRAHRLVRRVSRWRRRPVGSLTKPWAGFGTPQRCAGKCVRAAGRGIKSHSLKTSARLASTGEILSPASLSIECKYWRPIWFPA